MEHIDLTPKRATLYKLLQSQRFDSKLSLYKWSMMRKLELFVGNIDRLPHRVYLIMIPSHKYLLNPIYIKKNSLGTTSREKLS